MLEYLRNASERPIAKVLIGILMFSFVGWGVAEWIFGATSNSNTIATVGNTEISFDQFNNEKSRNIYKLSKEQQKQLYKNQSAMNDFNKMILSDLSNRFIIKNHASDLEFVVKDKQVINYIRADKQFFTNGKFAPEKFDESLMKSGMMEDEYADIVRENIMNEMVMGGLSVDISIPEFVIKSEYNSRYGKRLIKYATVSHKDFKTVENPTDAQLREFYDKNPQIVSESRKVSYVLVSANLDTPDDYDAGYKMIQKLEDDVIGGDSFEVAAKRHGAKFVSLPAFAMDKRPVDSFLTDSVVSEIFNSDEGLESEIIETKKGFAIFRVEQIIPKHSEKFEIVKNKLIGDWKTQQQKKQAYLRANDLLINLNKSGKLDGGKQMEVSRTSGAPIDVLMAAFSNRAGTKIIVEGRNVFYVLNIEKEIAPKIDNAKMKSLQSELENMNKKSIREEYNLFLHRKYPLDINEKIFNKMFLK